MRKIVISIIISVIMINPAAKARGWNVSGVIAANYSETAVSDNWSAGEVDARSWLVKGDGSANKDEETTGWLNTLKVEFGKSSLGGLTEQENADLIDFDSVYTYKLSMYANPYVALTADSQFTELFDPAVLGESAGIGWVMVTGEKQNLKTRVGAALRQTVSSGMSAENTTGGEWITNYDLKVNKNAKLVSEFKVFSAFDAAADMRWDSSFFVKLGKYLTAQAGYLAVNSGIPGRDFSDTVQTRLTFGLGVSYNLF